MRVEKGQWSYDGKKIIFQRKETLSACWVVVCPGGGGGEDETTEKREVMICPCGSWRG